MAQRAFEVIVIGAGAAGLAAAAELAHADRSVLVLEARERIGGRAWTRRMPGLDVPVELGAEFIHGGSEATYALLKSARIGSVASTRTQRYLSGGRLRPINAFAQAQKAMRDAAILRDSDMAFADYLARTRVPAVTRTFARLMVQGFDAADPRLASAREIVAEWAEVSASQPRPLGGYGPLVEFLAREAKVQLQTVVREVRWKHSSVELRGSFRGEPWSARAPRAIIALPLGVLQSRLVRFTPRLRKPLDKLESGPVVRVAMAFRNAFWEKEHPGNAFFYSPDAPFPTFWTPLPMHAPLLTAWAGGPKAAGLTGSSEKKLLAQALASVRSVLGSIEEPSAFAIHDWQADPYARGGYSYVRVGGTGARQELAAPLEETLYFAGEATDLEQSGTVGGALASGLRAAKEIR